MQGLIGHGDDRGFDRTAADRQPTEPRSYRSLQEVTIERRSSNGKLRSLRVVPGSSRNQIGVSESYVARGPGGALDHGTLGLIDPLDDDGATGDCHLLHGRNPGTAAGLPAPRVRRTGAATRRVHLEGAVRNGLIVLSPSINWKIDVDLDFSGSKPQARVSGRHDNFPGYEMYLGKRPIYQWVPASIRKKRLPVMRVGGAIAGLFADHPIPTAKPPRGGGGFGGGSSGGGGAGR